MDMNEIAAIVLRQEETIWWRVIEKEVKYAISLHVLKQLKYMKVPVEMILNNTLSTVCTHIFPGETEISLLRIPKVISLFERVIDRIVGEIRSSYPQSIYDSSVVMYGSGWSWEGIEVLTEENWRTFQNITVEFTWRDCGKNHYIRNKISMETLLYQIVL